MDRWTSLTGRPAAWEWARRPVVADAGLVVLLLVFAIGHDWFDHPGNRWVAWVFDVLLVLPLLFRRRRPTVTFFVIAALALAQWTTGTLATGDFAVLAALYAVGAHEPRRARVALAAAVAQLGVVMAVMRWAPPGQSLTGTIMASGTVAAAWILGVYLRTRRAYLRSVLDRAATAERERDQQALIAVASERARISREMHDIVAHSLSVMIALGDGAAIAASRAPEEARTAMLQSSALGRQALGEMRRLLGDLSGSPDSADSPDLVGAADGGVRTPQPGLDQLDDLLDQVRSAGLRVELEVSGAPPRLAAGAGLTVYRVVQEGLTNVLKHAPAATRAVVRLRHGPDGVGIEIENDGPAGVLPRPGRGRGLTGMRERAAAYGGTVDAAPRPAGGWLVRTHLELRTEDVR